MSQAQMPNINVPKIRYEYIWEDSANNYRSKIKVTTKQSPPIWSYDGSSTGQADTHDSERKLYPVNVIQSPFLSSDKLVYCFTNKMNYDNYVNKREDTYMYGFEQEGFLVDASGQPVGCKDVNTVKQGTQYCNVGERELEVEYLTSVEKRARAIGLNVTGWNLEVAPGQVEVQLCVVGSRTAAIGLHYLRYIMIRTAGAYGLKFNLNPKPFKNINGSGLHVNFSTYLMRITSSEDVFNNFVRALMVTMKDTHNYIIPLTGEDNNLRLCGDCEASDAKEFSCGVGDRLASVRLPPPITDVENRRYIEDRRWGSNADPFVITQNFALWAQRSEKLAMHMDDIDYVSGVSDVSDVSDADASDVLDVEEDNIQDRFPCEPIQRKTTIKQLGH